MPTRPIPVVASLIIAAILAAACGAPDTQTAGPSFPPTTATPSIDESPDAIPATEDPESPTPPAAIDLRAVLAGIVTDTGVPALGAGVVGPDGLIVSAVTGVRQRNEERRVAEDDRFHLGSNTKAMTAALVGVLGQADRGVSFDTTLSEAFPDIESLHPDYRGVTLGDLLSHTGGTPAHTPDVDAEFLALPISEQRARGTQLVLSEPPDVVPGAVSHYSNIGYVVVAAALEAATGSTWEALIETELFGPLGMDSCGFGPPGHESTVDQPRGHDDSGHATFDDNPAVLAPAGGVHCSITDWAAFLTEILNATRGNSDLLSEATAARLLQPAAAVPTDKAGIAAAMGWGVVARSNGAIYIHSGSNGAWFSQAILVPEIDHAVFAVTNTGPSGEAAVTSALELISDQYPTHDTRNDTNPSETITGHYWTDGTNNLICGQLGESFPPQCGGTSVSISPSLLPEGTDLHQSGSIQWTEDQIELELPTAG